MLPVMECINTLLVDDCRNFVSTVGRKVTIARTSSEALSILETQQEWDEIFLDHDLGMPNGKLDDVMPVVDFLCEQAFNGTPVSVQTIYVHTSNPAGARHIMSSLDRFAYPVRRIYAPDVFVV